MGIFGTIVVIIIVGLIAGAIARLLVPGTGGMGIGATIALGIVGSLIGGFLGYIIFHKDAQDGFFQPSGLIGSVIGAVIALIVYKAVSGRKSVAR